MQVKKILSLNEDLESNISTDNEINDTIDQNVETLRLSTNKNRQMIEKTGSVSKENKTAIDEMRSTFTSRLDEMQQSIQQLTKQVNDMKLIMTEEKKNDDGNDGNDVLKKQIQILQESVNTLMNKSLSKRGDKMETAMEKWLKNVVKLPQYIDLFNENGLEDLGTVKHLTQNELEMIGVDKFGHRLKIYKEIEKLNRKNINNPVPSHEVHEGGTAYI